MEIQNLNSLKLNGEISLKIYKILKYLSSTITIYPDVIKYIMNIFMIYDYQNNITCFKPKCLKHDCIIIFWPITCLHLDIYGDGTLIHCDMNNCHNIIYKKNEYYKCLCCYKKICFQCFQNGELFKYYNMNYYYDDHRFIVNCTSCQNKKIE